MKKIVIALLLVCTLAFFVACGTKKQEAMYTVQQYLPADPPPHAAEVEAIINAQLVKTIGAKVKLNYVTWGDYNNKLVTMTTAGEQIDTAVCFIDLFPYKDYMSRGGVFADITTELPKSAPDLYKLYSPEVWGQSIIGGKIGAIPIMNAYTLGFRFNAELMKKYNIDTSKIQHKVDFLEPLSKVSAAEKWPKSAGYGDAWGTPYDTTKYYPVISRVLPWAVDQDDPKGTIINAYTATDTVADFKAVYEMAKKGLVQNGTYPAGKDPWSQGIWFGGGWNVNKPDVPYNEHWGQGGNFVQQAGPNKPYVGPDFYHGVFASTGNLQKTLAYLNAVFTDPIVNHAIIWGVKDKDYQELPNNYVKVLPDKSKNFSTGGEWMFKIWGNPINLLTEGSPSDLGQQERTALAAARLPLLGQFAPDYSNIKTEVASISAIAKEYESVLRLGQKDPERTLKEFTEKMNAAGYEKVRVELQKQIDAYLASKK